MKNSIRKLYIFLSVLVLIGVGVGTLKLVSAATVNFPPVNCCDQNGNLTRNVIPPSVQLVPGNPIDLGSPGAPVGAPPSAPPFAKFSGIDAPVWLSSTGTPQVISDLIVYGLIDIQLGGLISNDTVMVLGGGPNLPLPVRIYDDLSIRGNGPVEPGNLGVNGNVNIVGNISVGGKITALNIGTFSQAWVDPSNTDGNNLAYGNSWVTFNKANTWVTDTAKCPTITGKVLSCTPQFWSNPQGGYDLPSNANNISWTPDGIGSNVCSVRLKQTAAETLIFIAMAECFDPTN